MTVELGAQVVTDNYYKFVRYDVTFLLIHGAAIGPTTEVATLKANNKKLKVDVNKKESKILGPILAKRHSD